jgi:hypothetical protein
MPTLRAVLKEVADFGPGYLLSEHGAYWLVADVLERLERDAPEKLSYSVSLVMAKESGDGGIYPCEDVYLSTSLAPLYRVHYLTSMLQPRDGFPDTWEHQP